MYLFPPFFFSDVVENKKQSVLRDCRYLFICLVGCYSNNKEAWCSRKEDGKLPTVFRATLRASGTTRASARDTAPPRLQCSAQLSVQVELRDGSRASTMR
ncbi:hypothetical protein L6452_00824 [Arctium lappa]|uniref:Uncharacterized protein n=1 Tax=Arctium lappa TaxID=4217 RepID=A0ACB9FFT8_ARCLA|nr:hypothetical protein L6452_00824 [Arctium lappa]